MSTLDVFADRPQGGWGGLTTHSENGGCKEQDQSHDTTHRGGGGEKETNPTGGGLEAWNIYGRAARNKAFGVGFGTSPPLLQL